MTGATLHGRVGPRAIELSSSVAVSPAQISSCGRAIARLYITACIGMTQLGDACAQKMPRDLAAPDADDRISGSSAPLESSGEMDNNRSDVVRLELMRSHSSDKAKCLLQKQQGNLRVFGHVNSDREAIQKIKPQGEKPRGFN